MTSCRSLRVLFIILLSWPTVAFSQWIDTLPAEVRASIIWFADYETGDLNQWQYSTAAHPGGGVLNTGDNEVIARVTRASKHSGQYSALTQITGAFQGRHGARAVRLMRWTDKPWDQGGRCLPHEAYYSTWMYIPMTYNPNKVPPWDPGDGGWWNVFQFKSRDINEVSQPMFSLNVKLDEESRQMGFYLYSHKNDPPSHSQELMRPIPVGRWSHLEAYYKVSTEKEGRITIWQNGMQIFDINHVQTSLADNDPHIDWGIGNYTDHIRGDAADGTATILFDDSIISHRRISEFLDTTRKNSVTRSEVVSP